MIFIDNIHFDLIYEAEELPSQTGQIVEDINASGGMYRFAAANESGFIVFGPYITIPNGDYIASFVLSNSGGFISENIATLDICISNGETIKNKTVICNYDFEKAGSFQSFSLPFVSDGESNYEFRIFKYPAGDLAVDDIIIYTSDTTKLYKYTAAIILKILIFIVFGLILAQQIQKIFLKLSNLLNITLFIFIFFVYVLIILGIFGQLHGITCDEPHYLITTYSIINDNDIYVNNNYLNEDYLEFYPYHGIDPHIAKTLDGGWISSHEIGLPLLLVIPYYLLGVLGVKLFLAIVASLVVLNAYLLAKDVLNCKNAALKASVIAALTSPLLFYSYSIFPDIFAALILIYSTRILYRLYNNDLIYAQEYLLCGIMVAFMPWLGIKYLSLMFPILLLFLMYWKKIKLNLVVIYATTVVSLLFYSYYLLKMFGSLSPTIRYGVLAKAPEISANLSIYRLLSPSHLASYFFDQQIGLIFYSPIYAFSIVGLVIMIKNIKSTHEFEKVTILLFPSICYYSMYVMSGVWGGTCPLSRPIVAIIPLVIVFLSIGITYASQKMMSVTINGLCVLSLGIAVILIKNPSTYIQFHQTNLLTHIIKTPFIDLTVIFPSFIDRNIFYDWVYLSLWITLLIIFAAIEYICRQKIMVDDR